jgi:integrase
MPNSPYWIACFTLPGGRQTQRSTKETDRDKALRIAIGFEDAARKAKAGRLTEAQARKVIADIYSMVNPSPLRSSTVCDFFKTWLERKENEAGGPTHRRYSVVVGQFLKFIGEKADRDLMHLTVEDLRGFRDEQMERVTAGTANVAMKVLRSALKQAQREGLVSVNEATNVPLFKRESFERRGFTMDEIQKVLKVVDLEWKGMVLTGLYTGLRLGDISTLRWGEDVEVVALPT